jgi:cytoskeleton protein RodZ
MQPPDATPTAGVGALLRAARERRELSVEQVSEATRVRATLIRQIEADDYSSCGGAVYARGHIRSIARVVELDPTPLIEEFDRVHELVKPPSLTPAPEYDPLLHAERSGRRGFAWAPAMIGSLVVICLLALIAVLLPNSSDSTDSDSNVTAAQTQPTEVPEPPATSAVPPPPATTPPTNLTVRVEATDAESWLDVRIAGTDEVLVQRLLMRGEQETVVEERGLRVRMGSAGAVDLSCNGQNLGAQGNLGEVVTLQLTLDPAGTCQVSGDEPATGVAAAAAPR